MGPSGEVAESGEALRKRFKRAVVSGGKHKGARYTDLSPAELHKCAKSYRGDQRFHQYCKQWAAISVLGENTDSQKVEEFAQKAQLGKFSWIISQWVWIGPKLRQIFKGRFLLGLVCFLGFMMLISRPSFSLLCAKLIVLSIRTFTRMMSHCIVTLLDGILEEAVSQVEAVLNPSPQLLLTQHKQENTAQPVPNAQISVVHSVSHWIVHLLCVIAGSIIGRLYQTPLVAAPVNRNPVP